MKSGEALYREQNRVGYSDAYLLKGNNMPRRTDIKKILVIGSGPIVIGQAAEFDYAGTQA